MADLNGDTDLTLETLSTGSKDFPLVTGYEEERQQLVIDLHAVYGELSEYPSLGFRWMSILGKKGVRIADAQELLREYITGLSYVKALQRLVVTVASLGGGRQKMTARIVVNGKDQSVTL